ncbi:YciI family protein [Nocardioides sp. 503]|uniref:YciI family protein n=1 Tax=Nocardioides sp. 503 TaxID=2508326 RepID=UPI00106FFF1F|nr:YciI family protein [Nocardioides sp. 503]
MPRFVTIGYGDREGYDRTAPQVRDEAHAHDRRLQDGGVTPMVGVAGPPVQVRNHEAVGVRTTDGPYLRSALPVAGFAIVEASDLDEAVRLVSGTPCAVAHGVVEVWPLIEAD